MKKYGIFASICRQVRQEMLCNSIIALGLRFAIAQTFGKQFAGAFYGVLLFRNMMLTIVKQACQWFASGLPVHSMLYAMCQTRHQRRAFYQPLLVDSCVILLCW